MRKPLLLWSENITVYFEYLLVSSVTFSWVCFTQMNPLVLIKMLSCMR